MRRLPLCLAIFLAVTVSALPLSSPYAQVEESEGQGVDMTADRFIYRSAQETVTAAGNVVLAQDGYVLKADEVVYNIADDFAYASGNVILSDPAGDTYYAEMLELEDSMRRGLAQSLYAELEDGSRLWARSGVRKSPEKHVLKDARYTPCRACDSDPGATPPWALRASRVTRDAEDAMITYENARFEAWGTPVAYIPYFSHPDGTVDQKSGFLSPIIGFGSDFGFNAMVPYYWAIDPSMDATIGLRAFTREAPQLNLELRKRYADAALITQGSIAYSDRLKSLSGGGRTEDEEWRGHFRMDGLWNINNLWRAGADIYLASDEQYLDEYDIDDEDVLENRLYLERFKGRDYASVEMLGFQDLRTDLDVDQPSALPLANASFVGAPDSVFGGRMEWNSSYLSLFREGNEQDVNRLSSTLAWRRFDILPRGIVARYDLAVRGDAYYTADRDIAKTVPGEDQSQTDSRLIPTANMELSYPMHKPLAAAQVRIKPMIGVTVRPDIDNDSDIPNEDSRDAQLDSANLFEIDRFPGLDRVEDRSRVNYGMEAGYYRDNGDMVSVFLGQSYRVEDKDNPFQDGSGLENRTSDVVGQIRADFGGGRHSLNYRFAVDGEGLSSKRHEIYGATSIYNTRLSGIYLFEKGAQGTEFVDSREQFRGTVRHDIDENWFVQASALYDLGDENGLRESQVGIGYDHDCYGVAVSVERDLQSDESGADDTTIMARFRLKNLGEFETTAFSDSSGDDRDDD